MAANPFLFTEDSTSNQSPQSTASFNPFLMDDDISQEQAFIEENPFFSNISQTATTAASTTNPFAFDPMDLEPAEAMLPIHNSSNQNDFMGTTSTNSFFQSEPVNFFTTSDAESSNRILISTSLPSPQKPTDLDLKYTTQDSIPMRPHPPIQSKATQDLLMSVMGEMDATSSHLLNKIPPTRSPSPVSMRDLQSPSPTPEVNFGDLLEVGDMKPSYQGQQVHHTENASNTTPDFMSMGNDINQNPPLTNVQAQSVPLVTQATPSRPEMPPPRPPAPARPPRPAPPQKPPPPAIRPMKQDAKPDHPVAEQRVVPAPSVEQRNAHSDDDMFGIEGAAPHPKIASKADILNLYNVKPGKPQPDLLFDTIEPDVSSTIANDEVTKIPEESVNVLDDTVMLNTTITNKEEEMSITPASSGINTANAMLSPASNEMHMDTSDSQSKGSVSSVTFNPFAVQEGLPTNPVPIPELVQEHLDNAFQKEPLRMEVSITPAPAPTPISIAEDNAFDFDYKDIQKPTDDFDAFSEKFDAVRAQNGGAFDAFSAGDNKDAWGNEEASAGFGDSATGFGNEEPFDSFLAMQAPQTAHDQDQGFDDDEQKDFSVVIRPKTDEEFRGTIPILAPPPVQTQGAFSDSSPRFNPFDQQSTVNSFELPLAQAAAGEQVDLKRTDSQESPSTPLFDDDISQPLEPFPRTIYQREGWEMYLRQPNKKKITGQRFWKKIFVKLVHQPDCVLLQLFNQQADKDPFQELPLQPCYSVSDIGAQQYDQFGKIFTIKLQYIFYKERPGVRPGQVKKAERITNKLSQFAAYAIQGDYQGVKEFGSDLKKLGLPVEHAPQVSQLMKLGSLNYEDLKQFSFTLEESLFTLQAHRDRALHYKMEEVQITMVDELYVEQSSEGHIEKQIARVRLFFLGFLTGMPDVELGLNDMRRQGREVVGRHDIIPVATEEWIRIENVDFHSCIQQEEYENNHIVRFKPPDACYIELMRFRVRPPKNRELPLQLKAQIVVTGTRIELRADVLVPGFTSRKLGQIPCEDVMIRFPIPECWIYMFRTEKHFRYGSVKSAHRRTGKIKGIERILGTMETPQENLIEVTSGQAKYEHQHRAIVWRCPRLPKEGQGAYTTHNMVCKIALTSYDQMPEKLADYCYVEFTMPATQVSHTVCRSVSLQNSDSDEPPEKYVRYLARHEYRVGIEHTEGENPNPYAAATYVTKPVTATEPVQQKPAPVAEESSSDSD